jgi:Protein of unknown function (DUF3237)
MQSGTATAFEQHYFRTTPRFETSDARYASLQQGVFVGQDRIVEGLGVEYNIFRVKEANPESRTRRVAVPMVPVPPSAAWSSWLEPA